MRKLILFIALLSLALILAACGSAERATGPVKYRFAIIPKALDIPVFSYAKIGAERAAQELGNVEIIWRAPETADQLKQKELLESFITQKVDGIAISCINGDFMTDTINKAIDAGIPVITWDADAPRSKRLAYWGVDDFKAGQTLAREGLKIMGTSGRVAIITSIGAYNLQRRLDGVQDVLKQNPGIQVVEVFDIKEDTIRCAELIASATNKYGALDAWIATGGWPVFTRNALDPIDPARTKVFCFDPIPPAPDILKAGKAQILIGQKYFGWGSESVKLLADIKAGKMPPQKIIDSGVDIVTAANVDEYVANFKRLESGK